MHPAPTAHLSKRLPGFLFLLLLPAGLCAQAGTDRSPDNPFEPLKNFRYESALNALRMAGNFAATAADTKTFEACLQMIEPVYRTDGNCAAALELLTGLPVPRNFNPALQMQPPGFSFNMQQLVDVLKKRMNTDVLQASLYGELSAVYEQIGDTVRGLAYQIKATSLLNGERILEQPKYVEALLREGKLYLSAGNTDSAVKISMVAENELREKKDSAFYISYLDLKGLLYRQQNRLTEAINVYEEVFKRLKRGNGKHRLYYEMACTLGQLYTQVKKYEAADSVLARNFHKLHELQYESALFQQTAEAYFENALCLKKNAEISERFKAYLIWLTGTVYQNSRGLAEGDLLYYTKRLNKAFDIGYDLLLNQPQANGHGTLLDVLLFLEVQRKCLVLTNRLDLFKNEGRIYYSYNKKIKRYAPLAVPTNRLRMTNDLVAKEYSRPLMQRRSKLDSLEERSRVLERELAVERSASFPEDDKKEKTMRLLTDPGTANIQFVRFTHKEDGSDRRFPWYGAFVFHQFLSAASFVPLCSEASLLKLMKNDDGTWMDENDLTPILYGSESKQAGELYRLVWQPLETCLKDSTRVNYSATGFLSNIAFDAIHTGTGYLVDRYDLHCFASLLTLSEEREPPAAPKFVSLWGDIDYEPVTNKTATGNTVNVLNNNARQKKGVDTLPFPHLWNTEFDTLKKMFSKNGIGYKSMDSVMATEEVFKQQAPLANGIIHLSTHGFYTAYDKAKETASLPGNFLAGIRNPLFRSGLAFAGINRYWRKGSPNSNGDDGLLTAYEIEQMNLHHTQMVVLSACETGLGDVTEYEGNVGLQRAFKLAGVRYLLVSLWSVGPKPTRELLTEFYENWLKGTSLNEALRKARKAMLQKGKSPYSWAGFVLIE